MVNLELVLVSARTRCRICCFDVIHSIQFVRLFALCTFLHVQIFSPIAQQADPPPSIPLKISLKRGKRERNRASARRSIALDLCEHIQTCKFFLDLVSLWWPTSHLSGEEIERQVAKSSMKLDVVQTIIWFLRESLVRWKSR